MAKMLKLGFIGAGTVATTLAVALSNRGYPIVAVSSRSQESARKLAHRIRGCIAFRNNQEVADNADIVFITTPDDVIASVSGQVNWRPERSVVHCSGAHSTDILSSARESGACVGVFHPLQTFASFRQDDLSGITFALEAEEPLLATLKDMTTALNGHWIELKAGDKVLYHSAAVFACNYLVTLAKTATDLWQSFNIPPEQAITALLPLMRGTINNIDTIGIPQCLTGPIARGDAGTIKKHLIALQKAAPELVATYQELGLKTIPIALAKGKINDKQADELKTILSQPIA
jgi:predicted short-subunit dehydrogenase-like oxidoreductase (DUF2520 family)